MRIGVIGFGTIGKEVARAIKAGRAGPVTLAALLEVNPVGASLAEDEGVAERVTGDSEEFFESDFSVVVEAAGHQAVRAHVERALRSGRDVIAVSAGAFSDPELLDSVSRAARESGRRISIPSGSLAALDAISAGAIGEIEEITLIARKPPGAWKNTPAEEVASGASDHPIRLYEGGAREAARLFPQNVNVVAALSLAGVGFDRTTIRMFSDPSITRNVFELEARGEFGKLQLTLENVPYPENPKTGRLVVLSLIKAIRRLTDSFVVGF